MTFLLSMSIYYISSETLVIVDSSEYEGHATFLGEGPECDKD
jgi:hypothetical protein